MTSLRQQVVYINILICIHYSVNDAMSLINRRTYFLLLCLLVFVNFAGFLWEQQRNRRHETNVFGNSVREVKLVKRSVSLEGSDPALAETNSIAFQMSGEGDTIEQTEVIRFLLDRLPLQFSVIAADASREIDARCVFRDADVAVQTVR